MALAAACVHRTGGVHMQVLVTPALHTLVAVVRGSSAPAKLWALHALWIISNAAGPSCIQHVPDVQATMRAVLLQDDAYAWPGMRPTLGRLANALVAVMGPEFQLGSDAYVQVKSIIRDMQVRCGVGTRCGVGWSNVQQNVTWCVQVVDCIPLWGVSVCVCVCVCVCV